MVDQQGHGLNLLDGRAGRDGVGHIGPVVGGLAKVSRQRAVFRMILGIVGMAPLPLYRMAPIAHQLGGGSSHTTRIAVSARTASAFWTKVVVGIVLVPFGLHEVLVFPTPMTRHHATCLFQHRPIGGDSRLSGRSRGSLHHPLTNAFEIVNQGGCHVVRVKDAFFGIADDGTVVVVARDDDEPRIAYVEHIIAGFTPIGEGGIHQVKVRALA